jgi:hypothetical protein
MLRYLAVAVSIFIVSDALARDTTVKGRVRKDGKYVAPHHRTAPNKTRTDNYSSKPNVNPYTGKSGRVDPYAPPRKARQP